MVCPHTPGNVQEGFGQCFAYTSGGSVSTKCPTQHRLYRIPNSLTISVEPTGQWFVSFNFEQVQGQPGEEEVILRTPEELAYEYGRRSDLDAITVGIDRGVAIPLAVDTGQAFRIDPVCVERVRRKEVRAQRYQKRMARQTKGSQNQRKTQRKIAKLKAYGRQVRKDFAHKASHALATSSAHVFVLEDLKLKNMTAAPAPKQDGAGRYTANGAAVKAGLNKALLSSARGGAPSNTSATKLLSATSWCSK